MVAGKHAKGYTLVELMAVLGIASIILLIATPMFRTQMQNSRMSAAATDLLSTFASARAEAVGRRYPVIVCIRNAAGDDCVDPDIPPPHWADPDIPEWDDGWLTFVDLNDNGDLNPLNDEDIIQIHPPLANEIFATGQPGNGNPGLKNSITFRPNGSTSIRETLFLIICDGRDGRREDDPDFGSSARALIISILGNTSIGKADDISPEQDKCVPVSA